MNSALEIYKKIWFHSIFFNREHEILREEIKSLQEVRKKLQLKVQDLEDELKKSKEDAEKSKATK